MLQRSPEPVPTPVIVQLYETPHDPTGLSDVVVGALGLTGALVVLAIVAAGIFGAVLFWRRSRTEDEQP